MRLRVLPLPGTWIGDVQERPFALILDQVDPDSVLAQTDPTPGVGCPLWEHLSRFRRSCGARALLVTAESIDLEQFR